MKVRSRFSYFRDKLQVFFLGFLLGIVLGGGFFVLKLDSYVKDLAIYKSLTQKDDKNEDKDLADVKDSADKPRPKKPREKTHAYATTDNIASHDSSGADSMPTAAFSSEAGGDEIVIRKDEKLGEKVFAQVNLDAKTTSDSAPSKDISADGPPVTVEFWKSPLNYKGYKFSRSRLVLFGLGQEDVQSIFRLENSTFLKTMTGVFRIEPSSDFHQLERVTDESLLARIP